MALTLQPIYPRFVSEDAYLAELDKAERPPEYFGGVIHEFVATTLAHGQILANLISALVSALQGKKCIVAAGSGVRAMNSPDYFFPDVSVVCGQPSYRDERRRMITNPIAVFEILSPSTEATDRGSKFHHVKQIESIREYVLLSQYEAKVEILRRTETPFWLYADFNGLDAIAEFTSLGVSIPLSDIYRDVELDPSADATA